MKQNKRCYKFSEVLTIINGRNQRKVEDVNGCFPIYGSGGVMGWANDFICPENTTVIGRKGSINNPIFVNQKFWNVDTAFGLVANQSLLLPKYLYYFCVSFNFEALNTTVTIPSLTKANLLNIDIPVPSIKEQEEIVRLLDHLLSLSNTRRKQLQKLDTLASSRFVEMFGVLGSGRWGIKNLGSCCETNPQKSSDGRLVDELTVSFVPMSEVSESGDINTSETKKYNEVKKGFTYFSEDDVLFAKITPCMENGKGAIARNLKNGIGFGSTEFHVLRPHKNRCNSCWLYYVTKFDCFRKDAERNMTGSAGQKRVPARFLENYPISVPPLELQNEFAAFIEQLDKSKVTIRKSIEKLELLYKALLQEYFG